MDPGTPSAEVLITDDLVRRLIETQFPVYRGLRIEPASVGWDNVTFRLGEELAVRLPRREIAVALIRNEQRWLPTLDLPIPIPVPVGNGNPGDGYPWPWSIVPWIEGTTANLTRLEAPGITTLTVFLECLHQRAPEDAPTNAVRGVPLHERAATLTPRLERLRDHVDRSLHAIWEDALEAPFTRDHIWIHGDFHARNVLIDRGELAAVIDWGDIARGDPATDLAAFWCWVPEGDARWQAMVRLGHDCATWRRARGWAFLFSVVMLDSGLVDHPEHAAMGRAGLDLLARHPEFPGG